MEKDDICFFEDERSNHITEAMFRPDYYKYSKKIIYHNPWVCSYCFKILKSKNGMKKHIGRCSSVFRNNDTFGIIFDGIINIDTRSNRKILKIIERMGYISKLEQQLDFPVTSIESIKLKDAKVLCKVINAKPIGYIMIFKKRGFWILQDFFIVKHMRGKGYSKQLYESVLEYTGENSYSLFYDQPNEKMMGFLKSIGVDTNKICIV